MIKLTSKPIFYQETRKYIGFVFKSFVIIDNSTYFVKRKYVCFGSRTVT